MIVPQYWAEARVRDRIDGRQVTVRRCGWSDEGQAMAQAHAETRERGTWPHRAGASTRRRERKFAYNGADGFPIREEVLERHGETVITRNSDGSRCLNTPNVLFIDIDFPLVPLRYCFPFVLVLVVPGVVFYLTRSWFAMAFSFAMTFLAVGFLIEWLRARWVHAPTCTRSMSGSYWPASSGSSSATGLGGARLPHACGSAGTRNAPDVQPGRAGSARVFDALGVDPLYALMCYNQKCFCARVSPKPWRVGIDQHIRPRRPAFGRSSRSG